MFRREICYGLAARPVSTLAQQQGGLPLDGLRQNVPCPEVSRRVRGARIGKAPEGKTYPAIYVIGKVGDTSGFFRCDDVGASWVRITDDRQQYRSAAVIVGDPRIYGRA
jgi:hypothetical protein